VFYPPFQYNKEGLAAILERIANMSTMDRDFDLCVTVLTADDRFFPHLWWKAGYDECVFSFLIIVKNDREFSNSK
jgi:hypothetical protein